MWIAQNLCSPLARFSATCCMLPGAQETDWPNTSKACPDALPRPGRYKANDLYLTGESYAGQYVPNIAHFIVNNEPFKSRLNLKGLALGNACWGGTL